MSVSAIRMTESGELRLSGMLDYRTGPVCASRARR